MAQLYNCSCLHEAEKKTLLFALDILRAESKNILQRIERKELVGSAFYDEAFKKRTQEDIEMADSLIEKLKNTPNCLD